MSRRRADVLGSAGPSGGTTGTPPSAHMAISFITKP